MSVDGRPIRTVEYDSSLERKVLHGYSVDETHMKKVRHRRPHTVGLLLYKTSGRGKSTEPESRLEVTGG